MGRTNGIVSSESFADGDRAPGTGSGSLAVRLGYSYGMSDDQDRAEDLDEDMIGTDAAVTSDQAEVEYPPERPHGIQFADADVTDESFAERSLQEEPEVWEAALDDTDVSDD